MGTLVFQATAGGSFNFVGPNIAGTVSLTLPSADGTSGQFLKTDGAGTLSFAAASTAPGGSTTQVQYNNAGAFAGITGATTNGTTLTLVAPVLGAATGTSFQGIIGNVTPSTGAFTTLSATKATGGDAATFTNAAASNKTGYIYTDNRYVGLFTSANGGGSGFASDTSAPNAYIQVGGAAIVTAITTGAAVTGLLDISAATSGQIKFPATQNASSDANTLDDYEEGTYTPTVASMTTTGTPVYVGAYTKIGRQVVISICGTNQTATTYTATANSTNFTVPFTSLNNGNYAKFVGGWSVYNAVAGGFVHVQNGSTQADFVTSMTSTNGFSATVTYFV